MKTLFSALILAILLSSYTSAQTVPTASLKSVAEAENSFADMAAKEGTRAAFLQFAASDGLVFSDKPENAQDNWKKRPVNATLLAWRPSWADVSANGELGYTTGTWAFSRTKDEAPVAWGEYFTIWRKQADGSLKFALDLGIGHDKADVVKDNWKSPTPSGKASGVKASENQWRALENSFSEALSKNGQRNTYEKLASDQMRLLIEGKMPFQGKPAAMSQIADTGIETRVLGGGASSNMAYAYGEFEQKGSDGKTEKGFYARVWKFEAKAWRVVAEVRHTVPPPKN